MPQRSPLTDAAPARVRDETPNLQPSWASYSAVARKFQRLATVLLLIALNASAQMPGPGAPAGISGALTRLFGETKAFAAKAQVRLLDGSQTETMSMPMDFALLDGNIRIEVDMTQTKNKEISAGAADQLKRLGMAQIISIIRVDRKLIYVIYPESRCLLMIPLRKEEAEAAAKDPKIQKTPLAKETIDGHACVKNKVTITVDQGQTVEATTWNATDMKDFPLQIQTTEKETTSIVRYKEVQFARPDPKQFEPPAGYTQYNNQMELMQGLMKKMTGGSEGK